VTKRSAALAVAMSATGLLLAGCLLPSVDNPLADPSESPAPVETTEPTPDPSGSSLEGAFDYDTMDQYVDTIVPWVEEWVNKTWPGMRLPRVKFVYSGDSGPESCTDYDGAAARYTSQSYEYCAPDNTVYVGQDTVWEFYDLTGDAGPAVGIAHEFGHHIQYQLNVPPPRTTDQSIRFENQADCLAGAWTKYMDETQRLEYPDDIEDIEALFPLIGSAEGPDRDHGTAAEREKIFMEGFNDGISACDV
jgi:predicted metalloprotease